VPEFRSRGTLDSADAGYFERMSDEEFERRFADTPLERPGLAGMRRNFRAAFATSPVRPVPEDPDAC
jgi:hypothetical protein